MSRLNDSFINLLVAIKEANKKNLTTQQQVVLEQIKETITSNISNTRILINDFISTCEEFKDE